MGKVIILIIIFIISVINMPVYLYSESIEDINKRAEEYYENKDFNKAITEWLSILQIDPNNEEIYKKIDSVYEEKFRKDSAILTAKIQLKLAKRVIDTDLKESNYKYNVAWNNLVTAYRIEPKDPEAQALRDEMSEFKKVLDVENRKTRLSEAMKQQYLSLLPVAQEKMRLKQYEEAIKIWNELLTIVPLDVVANEGKRQAELAIQNRLKYERLMALMDKGIILFNEKKYQESELEFKQALTLDPKNRDVKSYLEKINDILEEGRNQELIRIQTEQLYLSGLNNIRKKDFDRAQEDFENVISLIPNYKDVQERLRSLDRLKKEYEEQQRMAKLKAIDVQFEAGLLALSDGRYKDAIVAFEAVLALDPKNSLALKYIQTAKEAQEQIEEEIVTEDSPYYSIVNSLDVSGKLLYEKGDFSESRRRWEKILDLFPKNRTATEYLLKCNLQTNPDAFKDFSDKYITEGRALLKEKKYRQALSRFELLKSISPKYPGIDDLIASAKAGLVVKAPVLVSQNEIDNRIKNGIAYYTKGGAENLKLALQEFKWVITNDPDNTSALIYFNRIESTLSVGTGGQEIAVKKLDARQEKLVREHYFKGINLYFNNKFDEAITEWYKVLAIDPNNEKAKNNIRKCLVLLKR